MNLSIRGKCDARILSGAWYILAALELGEFLALEEDLEGGPDSRCCSERAVDIGRTIGEARPDGLINVNNWKVHNLEIGKWSHAASPAYRY